MGQRVREDGPRPAHALAFILAMMLRCGGLKGGFRREVGNCESRRPLKRAYSGAHPLCRLFFVYPKKREDELFFVLEHNITLKEVAPHSLA